MPSPEEISLRALSFPVSADTGFAVGDLSSVFMTADAGQTRQQVFGVPEGGSLNALYFPSGTQTGFAVGDHGLVLRGDNGGISWMIASRGFAARSWTWPFRRTRSPAMVLTPTAALMKTVDGGAAGCSSPLPAPVAALTFPLDDDDGLCRRSGGHASEDRGRWWQLGRAVMPRHRRRLRGSMLAARPEFRICLCDEWRGGAITGWRH